SFFAAALFQASKTTKNPYGEPSVLVGQMPYTFTRNPMYLGFVAALLGLAVFFGSLVMVAAPVIFVLTIDRLVIPAEEAAMERSFGEAYREYKASVRRWL
ncbi:MAG TPA: isoprenylcysteine carboxylmethyltransferase family protein, partial [Candidatus Binataceae bacterium]|nr:isoprenylcysteine carboxylmethyltransferase family protein [Candidatus Binataceae bacterium]